VGFAWGLDIKSNSFLKDAAFSPSTVEVASVSNQCGHPLTFKFTLRLIWLEICGGDKASFLDSSSNLVLKCTEPLGRFFGSVSQ